MFKYDVQRSGRSPYVGWSDNTLKWSYNVGEAIYRTPVIGADGTVYVGTYETTPVAVDGRTAYPGVRDYKLYAISSEGELKWTFTPGGHTSPTIAPDGTIYFGSSDNKLYALNPDGTLKWSYQGGAYPRGPPTIGSDGTVYFSSDKLYALIPDGTLKWSVSPSDLGIWVQPPLPSFTSPAIGLDGTIYTCYGNRFLSLNSDGMIKWSYTFDAWTFEHLCASLSPAIGPDGTTYVATNNGRLYAINPDGTLKWSYQISDRIVDQSPAIALDGTIYIGSGSLEQVNKLYALNPDGTLKWSYPLITTLPEAVYPERTYSSPIIGGDGTIYFGSAHGTFYALNPDGTLKWTYATKGTINSSPSIAADGTIYFGTWMPDCKLYAIGPPVAVTTQLTIAPATFFLRLEESITLTAALTSEGSPLEGKPIEWSIIPAGTGSISPPSGITDASGQVTTTYTAPSYETSVTITASFVGDDQYQASSGNSSGTIISLQAIIDIKPDTLQIGLPGRWVTCYIELLTENVDQIDIPSIRLEGNIPVDPAAPTEIGDYDVDGAPDLMVKFDRQMVENIVVPGPNVLTVTGLVGESTFMGTDSILVIQPPEEIERESPMARIDNIKTGESALVPIGNTSITGLRINAKRSVENVSVVVYQFKEPPMGARSVPWVPYRYMSIVLENVIDEDVENVIISFEVELSWVVSENIAKENIRLCRFDVSENEWRTLPTWKTSGENVERLYFMAESPGLSLFAITGASLPIVPTPVVPPLWVMVIAIIALVAVLLAVIWRYLSRAERLHRSHI